MSDGSITTRYEPDCEPDCRLCSGEACETHGTDPCECATDERHQRQAPAERLAFATAHAEAESYTAQLREALKKSVAGQQKAEADAARLREALRKTAILPPQSEADDWYSCRLCKAVWRIRESHKAGCLLAPVAPSTAQETRE